MSRIVFTDSCGDYHDRGSNQWTSYARYKYDIPGAGDSFTTTIVQGRNGGNAIRRRKSGERGYFYKFVPPGPFYVVGLAYRLINNVDSPGIVSLFYNETPQIQLYIGQYNEVKIARGLTEIASSEYIIPPGSDVWNYIEIKTIINDTDGHIDVNINGNNILTFSGKTDHSGSGIINRIGFPASITSQSGDESFTDDIYVNFLNHKNEYGFLGDVRVVAMTPKNDKYTDFVPNSGNDIYSTINQSGESAPDDESYAHGKTGDQTKHQISNDLQYVPNKVYGIQLIARVFPEGEPRPVTGIIEVDDRINYVVFNSLTADSIFSYIVSEFQNADPDGKDWTIESINQLVAGVKIE